MDDTQKNAEQKTDATMIAAAGLQDAQNQAREAQMESVIERAFVKMFAAEDSEGHDRFLNVSRVPLICQSIVTIVSIKLTTI